VFTPEADRLAQPAFRPDYEPMLRHANEATREVNRKQQETIRGKLTTVETRLADMDKLGIDVQAISPSPPQYYYWTPPELGRETARLVNNRIAEIVAKHPDGFSEGRRLADHYFINIIGNPLDSTVAVSHLIFGGVLDAHPRLKICVAHGGGFLPGYSGRSDHGHAARPDSRTAIKKKPTSYLKKLYFDSIVFSHHQLEYLAE